MGHAMKWKPGVFRESFESHKVGDEAAGLRPDMGPQRRASAPKLRGGIVQSSGRKGGPSRGASDGQTGAAPDAPAGGSPGRNAGPGAGVYALGRARRVTVKARYRTHTAVVRGGRQPLLAAHLRYLARPAATGLDRAEAFFTADEDHIDAAGVPARWARDRLHWRLIVSPEDGASLDLRRYARDYADRLSAELGTPLEWVAAAHRNTDHPHVHLVVRGVRAGGRDLTLPRDVVGDRLRQWAEELAARSLGERSEAEADAYLARLAGARRATGLDALVLGLASGGERRGDESAGGWLDVRVPRDWTPEAAGRHHLERRLETLATMNLAERTSPPFRRATWRVHADLIERLGRLSDGGADRVIAGLDAGRSHELAVAAPDPASTSIVRANAAVALPPPGDRTPAPTVKQITEIGEKERDYGRGSD